MLQRTGGDLLATDHERHLGALVAHLLEAKLETRTFGAAAFEAEDRLVVGGRGTEDRMCAHAPYITAMDLADVLWIGGGQGSGKSSIAWELSRRHGLQLYNVDHRTQAHAARQAPHEFATLSPDGRWLEPSLETMLRWFLETSEDRVRVVLEDVARLPAAPGAIVEGPQLFPSLIAPLLAHREQALFLVPDPAEQQARLLERGPMTWTSQPETARANAIERDLLISARFDEEARGLGLCAVAVDRPLAEMIELAEQLLAPALERVAHTGDLAAARRNENDALAEQVLLYRATGEAPKGYPELVFACECGEPGCRDTFELSLEEYEAVSAAADRSPLRRPTP
jgi:hypothetical protein